MKQSFETDKISIEKIIKYLGDIQDCFEHFKINSYNDFEKQRIAQLAVTQVITNIYEAKKYIQQITLNKIAEFDKIKLSVARNIASHDYESVNFKIIYDLSEKLMSIKTKEVLQSEIRNLGQKNN